MFKFNGSCAMESCISHALASVLSSRPKGFSKEMLAKRLRLRAMVLNSFGDKDLFSTFLTGETSRDNFSNLDFSIFDYYHKPNTYPVNLNYKYL